MAITLAILIGDDSSVRAPAPTHQGVEVKAPSSGSTAPSANSTAKRTKKGIADWREVLEGMVRRHAAASRRWPMERLKVEVEGAHALAYLEKHAPSAWDLVAKSDWALGSQPASIEVARGAESVSLPITVTLKVDLPVLVTLREIGRGERISAEDIEFAFEPSTSATRELLNDPSEVIGKQATHLIAKGRAIAPKDVRGAPVVFRGAQMTVWVRHGTATLQLIAMATEEGAVGEYIEAVNPASRQKLARKIRVLGPNEGEMTPESPPSKQAISAPPRQMITSPGSRSTPVRQGLSS